MIEVSYERSIENLLEKIKKLPPDELQYHLYLIIGALKDKNDNAYVEFVSHLNLFIDALHQFHIDIKTQNADVNLSLDRLKQHYVDCLECARVNRLDTKVITMLLNISGAILGLVMGLCCGLIGAVDGLLRGTFEWLPLHGLFFGTSLGFIYGAIIGSRLPHAIRDSKLRQLEQGLQGFNILFDQFHAIQEYYENADEANELNRIKNALEQKGLNYQEYIASDQKYSIKVRQATFLPQPYLKGYVGNHAFIHIDTLQEFIEFNTTNSPLDDVIKCEERTVKGQQIIDMLLLHHRLKNTTRACNLPYMLKKYAPGENDCFNYINIILSGTGQTGYKDIERFYGSRIEGRVFNFFVDKLKPVDDAYFKECLSCSQS